MKKVIKLVLMTLVVTTFLGQVCMAQGLAERRAIKQYQDEKLPELQQQINTAAGFEVPLEVSWDKLAVPGQSEHYMKDGFITNIFFTPLINALKSVAIDEMGKTALKEKLKDIKITSDENAPSSNYKEGVSFENGTLTLNFKTWSNADDVSPRAEAIQKDLEAGL